MTRLGALDDIIFNNIELFWADFDDIIFSYTEEEATFLAIN